MLDIVTEKIWVSHLGLCLPKERVVLCVSRPYTKYCPFIGSPELHKPAADCELELSNQSAVVSIVMLSPTGGTKKENGIGHMTIRTTGELDAVSPENEKKKKKDEDGITPQSRLHSLEHTLLDRSKHSMDRSRHSMEEGCRGERNITEKSPRREIALILQIAYSL